MTHYISTAEAGELLGFHRKTIELWCRKGILKAARPAQTPRAAYRIPMSEIRKRMQLVHPEPSPDTSAETMELDWEAVRQNRNIKGGGAR